MRFAVANMCICTAREPLPLARKAGKVGGEVKKCCLTPTCAKAPIHPRAFASVVKSGKAGTLSRQFYEAMASAGLVAAKKHRAADENAAGRSGRREVSEISFHALRHTATSLLKNAGVSPAIVQDIIGHESAAISANYTHIEGEAKRATLEKLPDIATAKV